MESQPDHNNKKAKRNSRSDKAIKKEIEKRLAEPEVWKVTDIQAEVDGGKVTLMGKVANKEALQKVETLVASINGVTQIINQMHVEGIALTSIVSEIGSEVSRILNGDNPQKGN